MPTGSPSFLPPSQNPQAPLYQPPVLPLNAAGPGGYGPYQQPTVQIVNPLAKKALWVSLAGCLCGILGFVGMFMGARAIRQIEGSHGAQKGMVRAVAAVAIPILYWLSAIAGTLSRSSM